MKRTVIIGFAFIVLLMPMVAYAEDPEPTPEPTAITEITPEPTITPEITPEPTETPDSTTTPIEPLESTTEPTATPYYYVLDDSTIIGGLASFMGVQDGENTPQNLGEAIPYVLRVSLSVGVLWFIYAMIRGFTGNVFGKARKGGQ